MNSRVSHNKQKLTSNQHKPGDSSRDLLIPYLEVTIRLLKGHLTIPQKVTNLKKRTVNMSQANGNQRIPLFTVGRLSRSFYMEWFGAQK